MGQLAAKMMHLTGPNVITDTGRNLSVTINTDLDVLLTEISPTEGGSTAVLSNLSTFFIFAVYSSLPQLRPLFVSQELTVFP